MTAIKDGTGQSYWAKVNNQNRLSTLSETITAGIEASLQKRGFLVRTDDVTLTSDSASAVLYFKYNGANKIVIPKLYFTANQSTGGASGDTDFVIFKNGTSGTIIDNATAAVLRNNNFSGVDTIGGAWYQGIEGYTIDGTSFATTRLTAGSGFNIVSIEEEPWVLETGNTISVKVTPPTGNTNMVVRVGLALYEYVE